MRELVRDGATSNKTREFHMWPYSDDREMELITEVVKSGKWWRMAGNKVDEFEKNFAQMIDVKYCLGVTNGTHAIELALTTLGIGAGDEVIVPAITFISTGTAVIYCNATPVLVDVDPITFCMNPEAFEKAITNRTKAVIPVHIAGHSCDMDKICEIAKRHGIKVIEDAAHAHGAEWKNRKLGSFGDMAIFSFQSGKLMTCGEGGAVVTNDPMLYEKAYLIHGVGRPRGDRNYEHRILGSNYRMNEFQAAILIAQQERLMEMNSRREKNASLLDKLLEEVDGITPQGRDIDATLVSHYMYMFYYNPETFGGLTRQEFVDCLVAEGIPAFISFPVLSDTEFFMKNEFASRIKEYKKQNEEDLVNSKKIARYVVWLPHYILLSDVKSIYEIVNTIRKIHKVMNDKKSNTPKMPKSDK